MRKLTSLIAILISLSLLAVGVTLPTLTTAQEATELPPFPTATPFPTLTTVPVLPTMTATHPPTLTPRPTGPDAKIVQMTCHAEPKWSFLINVRRGPSSNWGVIRQMAHNRENQEMWVIGRSADWDWYQVVLPKPYETEVGWVWSDQINVFGSCLELPVTEDKPEITLAEVPPAPDLVPLPDFAQGKVTLTPNDRAWLVEPSILYIRREIMAEDQKDRLQAHLVILDYSDPQLQASVKIGAVPAVGGVPVSQMASEAGATVAINGDFYAGNYFPQGLTVIDGEVVTAPKRRAAFGLTQDRQPFIGYFTEGWTWPAYVVAENGEVIPLQLMNVPCDQLWLCMYTHHRDNRLPLGFGGVRVVLDENLTVTQIIQDAGVDLPDGYSALAAGMETGQWLLDNVKVGDTLEIVRPTTPPWEEFDYVISGGPRLLLDGGFWADCYPEETPPCEEFDFEFRDSHYGLKSLPRSAVGYSEDTQLIYLLVVEGYEVDDSGGATRQELADMFLEFGATQAMEFDGGGSSTLYMLPNGVISDVGFEGERPVTNALMFFWND